MVISGSVLNSCCPITSISKVSYAIRMVNQPGFTFFRDTHCMYIIVYYTGLDIAANTKKKKRKKKGVVDNIIIKSNKRFNVIANDIS